MNKEFIRIDENKMIVFDEKGNYDYRNYTEHMPDVLVLENDLDYITDVVNELRKQSSDVKGLLIFRMLWNRLHLLAMPVLTAIATISTIISGNAIYLTIAIVYSFAVTISIIINNSFGKFFEKKNNGINQQIVEAQRIKKMISNKIKELSQNKTADKIIQNKKYVVPIQDYEMEKKQIEDAYWVGYNSSKNKVRTRKFIKK